MTTIMADSASPAVKKGEMQPPSVSPDISTPVTTSTPEETSAATKAGKNRFSLNALRLPFVSSPRKASAADPAADLVSADPKSPVSDLASQGGVAEYDAAANDVADVTETTASPLQPESASQPPSDTAQKQIQGGDQHLAPPKQVRPKRSSLSPTDKASSKQANRAASPHRVSFSPSTEEVAQAREQALSLASLGHEAADHHPSKSKSKPGFAKWRGLKSHSTSDLTTSTRRVSVDSTLTISSGASSSTAERIEDRAALPGAAVSKRRLFRWDRKGIHHSGSSDKAKLAKVKVTKHQALAARHAKTLEQVINAGMGLHPIPPRASSALHATTAGSPDQLTKGGKKKKVPQAKPIPMVDRSQLRGLKSALLDVDLANNIISQLRAMPVPMDALRSGLGKSIPDVEIGTAGDHGQERILTANLPDTALQGPISKDDSEIRKRSEATVEALDAGQRPPLGHKAKSAAEEALRKINVKADSSAVPQKALVTARTSSLPPSAEEASAAAVPAVPAQTSPPVIPSAAKPGARPLKMVCLDCGEAEAHRRHAEHLEAATLVIDGKSNDNNTDTTSAPAPTAPEAGAFNVTSIATGAVAALAGVGGMLAARSTASKPAEPESESATEPQPSTRPAMFKSMSVANLPTLQDGQLLMGSAPLQLLLDPVGTAAQNSGAFDVLANISGTAIRATQDMDAIHPPLDRMAIFVHWWGFEITLPKATMAYLGTAHSISGAFLSFLQTMAVGGGVPELLPFIKYISTFMEVEYKAIQAQDQGHGVCIAGTWFMPLALVPRPWDYPLDGPTGGASSFPPMPSSVPVASSPDAALMPMPVPVASSDSAAPRKKLAFKKKKHPTDTGADIAVAQIAVLGKGAPPQQPVPPKRNLSPSQMAAIQAARTEKIPHDLSPRHSRSSSIASARSVKDSTVNVAIAPNGTVDAALASVQEMPEVGSVIVQA